MNGKLAVVGTYDGRCIFYETEVCAPAYIFYHLLLFEAIFEHLTAYKYSCAVLTVKNKNT